MAREQDGNIRRCGGLSKPDLEIVRWALGLLAPFPFLQTWEILMCNLYSMTHNVEPIRQLFRVGHNRVSAVESLPAIFPGHRAPVVRPAADGDREMVSMGWGFVLPQQGKATRRVTNARDDKLNGGFWANSFFGAAVPGAGVQLLRTYRDHPR